MAQLKNEKRETTREEDYRDYEERDLDRGWPYADEDRDPAARNAPYGSTQSNFDETQDIGAEIAEKTAIASDGGPQIVPSSEEQIINDDALEEKIGVILQSSDSIESSTIDVRVHNAVAELEGSVETEAQRTEIERAVLSVEGIQDCKNRLTLIGIDSHIPSDADE
ncbi:BON domain-containing protein [Rhizobium sp. L1K21]|uniref:BON domain-containing protein n=1 Tax=Rhizobium sp. L1K21 TaxID=2954933 RepID=UPI002093ECF0|nr:BON domain-containing protein [Rhizobium sp. L1K21]MCO6188584.1 BON domain-containing protein [Rhizobium sp. L1K21]